MRASTRLTASTHPRFPVSQKVQTKNWQSSKTSREHCSSAVDMALPATNGVAPQAIFAFLSWRELCLSFLAAGVFSLSISSKYEVVWRFFSGMKEADHYHLRCLFFSAPQPKVLKIGHDDVVSILEGKVLTLVCKAKGSPAPNIMWYKDNQPITARDGRVSVKSNNKGWGESHVGKRKVGI